MKILCQSFTFQITNRDALGGLTKVGKCGFARYTLSILNLSITNRDALRGLTKVGKCSFARLTLANLASILGLQTELVRIAKETHRIAKETTRLPMALRPI